jgi:hypothetical protein
MEDYKVRWRRFSIYERIVSINALLIIVIYTINEDFVNFLPKEILGYLFWLSLGLYLGFQWCKYEFRRVWKKMREEEKKEKENSKTVPQHGQN